MSLANQMVMQRLLLQVSLLLQLLKLTGIDVSELPGVMRHSLSHCLSQEDVG